MQTRLFGVLMSLLLIAGCGSGEPEGSSDNAVAESSGSPSPEASPTPDQASLRRVAEEVGARFGAQDYTGYYDLWTSAAQAESTRDEYAAAAKACGQGGVPTEVEDVRIEPDGSGVVRVGAMGMSHASHYLFEDGQWRLDPDRQRLKDVLAGSC